MNSEIEALMPDPDRRDAALTRLLERFLTGRGMHNRRGLAPSSQFDYDAYRARRLAAHPVELDAKDLMILRGLSYGLSRLEICDISGFKLEFVKSRLKKIQRLLAAKTVTEAVANAIRQGIID